MAKEAKTTKNTNTVEATVCAWIPSVLTNTARLLRGKHGLNAEDADECALMALEYALKPSLTGTGPLPASASDLQALTNFKAKNLAKDHFRRALRSPIKASIDAVRPYDDDAPAESPLVQRASYANWCAEVREADRKALGAELYARLDELFDRINLSTFRRDVFKAAYLNNESTRDVSERFGIKPNYVYNIVFNTKAALARLAS